MYQGKAYSAESKTSPLASIPRRDANARDVQIEILFCGICLKYRFSIDMASLKD